MTGELIVAVVVAIAIMFLIYMVVREPRETGLPPVRVKVPMPPVKAPRVPVDDSDFSTEMSSYTPRRGIVNASTEVKASPSRSQYPTGNIPAHNDAQASDLLSTMIILDAIDDTKYSAPTVDTYQAPAYSEPSRQESYTPSYSSCSSSSSSDSSSSPSPSCD